MIKKYSNYYRLLLMLFALFLSQSAAALSLGEIHVRSHFAEPFLAEISLPSYTAEEMESINIHIASRQQFEEMGYDYSSSVQNFHFEVKENAEGNLYIEVRSDAAVKELSVSLLIEVTTISGRIVKGYDILLTPKAISAFEPQQTPASQQSRVTLQTKPLVNKKPSPTQKTTPSKIKKLSDGGLEYTSVGNGESLSRIAQKIRPRKSMHMLQVMLALYKQNPDAFVNGNINNLKAGVSLKLHDIDSIEDVNKLEAAQLVLEYGDPQRNTITENRDENTGNRLQISSTEDEGLPPDVLEEIRQEQIASVQGELDEARKLIQNMSSENRELKDRIALLEAELDKAAESLFLAQTRHDDEQDKKENTLVMNAKIDTTNTNQPSFFSQYQTTFSLIAAILLAMALIAVRKKEALMELVENIKHSGNKSEKNIFS